MSTESLILYNGTVHTLDSARPRASALGTEGERITFVGDDDAALALKGSNTHLVDLQGKTVIPGLADAHGHMRHLGQLQEQVALHDGHSWQEAVERVKERAGKTPRGQWVIGRGWNQELWPERALPTHHLLSQAVPDNPVWLVRVDGHAGVANAAAMRLCGIGPSALSPAGGLVVMEGGQPTGLFVDKAMSLIASRIPAPTVDSVKQWLLEAQALCLAAGLTQVHDAGITATELEAYRQLAREGRLRIGVYAMLARDVFEASDHSPLQKGLLTVRCVKIVLDGALGSSGAALLQPYDDAPDNQGLLLLTPDELRRTVDRAFRTGFQVAIHAIGDRACRLALDTIEAALRQHHVPDHRSRIEHAQVVAPEDIPRFAALGVIASVQPSHAASDMNMAEARLGSQRIRGAYAWRKLLAAGATLAAGSDFPVETHDPLWGLYCAVTRQDRKGQPPGGWYPEERMSMEEALRAFAVGTAYASFQEKQRGVLAPGYWADLVVLDRDIVSLPPMELLHAQVLAAMVGGRVAFSRMAELPE